MTTSKVYDANLQATFAGTTATAYGEQVAHYRNIRYGHFPSRFAEARLADSYSEVVDCKTFGPQCPQVYVDVGHLLRIPEVETSTSPVVPEDEFDCLNLNISAPASTKPDAKLPVVFWIHGGSQTVTFPSAASKCGDPSRIIAQSMKLGKPIILVTFNYRLNIFSFGDGNGMKNLALRDQRLALDWIRKHIATFGGNPSRITVAGESAGAVYAHALSVTDPAIKSIILASGSLYLSPPLPTAFGDAMHAKITSALKSIEPDTTLATASSKSLVLAVKQAAVVSMWLQDEPAFANWQSRAASTPAMMIGDVEYESVIWHNGIQTATSASIVDSFNIDASHSGRLRTLYGVVDGRTTACRNGALDLINDVRFGLPAEDLWQTAQSLHGSNKAYRFLFDEPNPWQPSSRAHHAVDLLMLFGGFDTSHNPAANKVGTVLREKWILFANGEAPWQSRQRFVFGPYGRCGEIEEHEYKLRRREACFELLREMGWARYNPIFGALAAGRISLEN